MPRHGYHVAIDLSRTPSSVCSFIVQEDGSLSALHELDLNEGARPSESLVDGLDELLRADNRRVTEVQGWITNSGPGSFTGLRIALATLHGICLPLGKPLALANGSAARALSWFAAHPDSDSEVIVLTQASSQKFVMSRFQKRDGGVELRSEEIGPLPWVVASGVLYLTDRETTQLPSMLWPCRSSQLAELFVKGNYVREYDSPEQWPLAVPEYQGTREFARVQTLPS